MKNSNQILHRDQIILEGNFYRVVHATYPGLFLGCVIFVLFVCSVA